MTTTSDRPACLCGCGGVPKGKKSRFIPGHDAKLHSAQKKAAEAGAPVTPAPANAQDAGTRPARRRAVKDGATAKGGRKA